MHLDFLQNDCLNKKTEACSQMLTECLYDLAYLYGSTVDSYTLAQHFVQETDPGTLVFGFIRQTDNQRFVSVCICLPGREFSHYGMPSPAPVDDDEDVRTVKRRRVNWRDSLSSAVEQTGRWLLDQNGVDRRPNH